MWTSGRNSVESWPINNICFPERLRKDFFSFGSIFPLINVIFAAAKYTYFDFWFPIFKGNIKHLDELFIFLKTAISMEKSHPNEWRDQICWRHCSAAVQKGSVLLSTVFRKSGFVFFLDKRKLLEYLHELWNNKRIILWKLHEQEHWNSGMTAKKNLGMGKSLGADWLTWSIALDSMWQTSCLVVVAFHQIQKTEACFQVCGHHGIQWFMWKINPINSRDAAT